MSDNDQFIVKHLVWLNLVPVAALLVVATTGLTALISRWPGASTDAWMNFAGALVGAAVTVAGSVGVLEWQRSRESRRKRYAVRNMLSVTLGSLERIENKTARELGLAGVSLGHMHDLVWHVADVERGLDLVRQALTWHPPDNFNTLLAYREIIQITQEHLDAYRTEAKILSAQPDASTDAMYRASEKIRWHLTYAITFLT